MSPKRFAALGAVFGLFLVFILGGGDDLARLIGFTIAGAIVGFSTLPVGRLASSKATKSIQDE